MRRTHLMAHALAQPRPLPAILTRIPFYYGWIILGAAALAMVGTLPGRTQGLGLITESLLRDLRIDRVTYAGMNLWATLLGSLFCLGFGRWLDRWGGRALLTGIALALGAVVLGMSAATTVPVLFFWLVLSRGLGQSALSIVSLALVGQWFRPRLHLAMGLYALLLSVGFMIAFPVVGSAVIDLGWRQAWAGIGFALVLGLAPVAWLLVRHRPEDCRLTLETPGPDSRSEATTEGSSPTPRDATWKQAMVTPAFWVFALASSLYNLIASGLGLFNEAILAERGFAAGIYHRSLVITALTSLAGNLLGGWLANRGSSHRLMAVAMTLLAAALAAFPHLQSVAHVDLFASVVGLSGGFVMVIFFSYWARHFGRAHLGRIQGTAQMLTVIASAVGPILVAQGHEWTGSYAAVFLALATAVALFGLAALICPRPPRITD